MYMFLYIHVKPVIMYRICNYVCKYIGRIHVSNVHAILVSSVDMCDLYLD